MDCYTFLMSVCIGVNICSCISVKAFMKNGKYLRAFNFRRFLPFFIVLYSVVLRVAMLMCVLFDGERTYEKI